MKSSITRRSFVQLTGLAAASTLVACGTQEGDTDTQGDAAKRKEKTGTDILVAYFSRAGENYTEEDTEILEVGHTKVMAGYIAKALETRKYEIVPKKAYPYSYAKCCERASKELSKDARPKIAGKLPDVSKCKTIFLGCPIWWENEPMIIRTFLDSVDLSGKTIIPFTTYGSSGLGNVPSNLQARIKDATFLDGYAVEGVAVNDAEDEVINWAKSLEL